MSLPLSGMLYGGVGQSVPQSISAAFWLDVASLAVGTTESLLVVDLPDMALAIVRVALRTDANGLPGASTGGNVSFGFNASANDVFPSLRVPHAPYGINLAHPSLSRQGANGQTFTLKVLDAPDVPSSGALVVHVEGYVFSA